MFSTQEESIPPHQVERRELRRSDGFPCLGSAKDVERHTYRMLADAPPIERVSTRTGNKGWCQGDPILRPSAILHQCPDFAFRLASEGDGEAAISEAADGFLETIRGHLLDRMQDECVNR
jgi:hypothetical protein